MVSEARLIPACIFGYAIAHSTPRVLLFIAVEDIVSGTLTQSSFVLLLFSCGDTVVRMFALLMFKRIPLPLLMMLLGILYLTAYLLLVAVDQVKLRLAGAFFVGCETGLSNVIILNMIAKFDKVEQSSSAYKVGISTMTLLSAMIYTGK